MTPYEEFKPTVYWEVISKALEDLEKNRDINITTNREYVIGSLVKEIMTVMTKENTSANSVID